MSIGNEKLFIKQICAERGELLNERVVAPKDELARGYLALPFGSECQNQSSGTAAKVGSTRSRRLYGAFENRCFITVTGIGKTETGKLIEISEAALPNLLLYATALAYGENG